MTLAEEFTRINSIFIDTAPIIYYIEAHPDFGPLAKEVVTAFQSGNLVAYSSVMTLTKENTPMPTKEVTELTVADLLKEYKRNFREDYWEMHEEAVKEFRGRFIEEALEEERAELICCAPHERNSARKAYRNGYWKRWITLKDGRIEIRMPRIRSGGYASDIIPRYQQRVDEVDKVLLRIFLYGASTRLTGEALRPLSGEGVSAQTVSNIAKSLDEGVREYHNRRLQDRYLYLVVEAQLYSPPRGQIYSPLYLC